MFRSDFSRPPRALQWVRFVLSASSCPLSGEEIFRCIHDEVEHEAFMTRKEVVFKWDHSHLVFASAIRWGCRHGDIVAKARRCGTGSARFEVVPVEEWAYLKMRMSGCDLDTDISGQCKNSIGGCSWHAQPGAYRIVSPTGVLIRSRDRDKKPQWEMVVYSLAHPAAERAPEVSRPTRDDTAALAEAIRETMSELGRPGQDMQWQPWCDRVRTKAGVGSKRWGFGDKSIQRAVKRLTAVPRDILDKPDI
jgi:hypothetical protein